MYLQINRIRKHVAIVGGTHLFREPVEKVPASQEI